MDLVDKTLAKFIIVGCINTGIGAALTFSLYNIFGVNYWFSSAASYIAGSVISFFLNKYFTFNARHWSAFMVIAFIANIGVCYLLAYGIAKPVANWFLHNAPQKIRENTALFAGMCLFTGLNYTGQRLLVFRKNNPKE